MLNSAVAKMLAVWCVFTLPVAGVVAQQTDEPDTAKANLNKLLDLLFEARYEAPIKACNLLASLDKARSTRMW